MAIEKVYPQLRCSACGGELESTEPETEYVFVLSVKPCKRCAAQQSVQRIVLKPCQNCGAESEDTHHRECPNNPANR